MNNEVLAAMIREQGLDEVVADMHPEGLALAQGIILSALDTMRERQSVDPAYAAKNPLGGPAKVFRAIAERIEAGEDYDAVLKDYDLVQRSGYVPEGKAAIIRNGSDGQLDEVFAEPCQFHLEQMDTGHWWIGINAPDKFYHINLHSKGRIKAFIEGEERHEPSGISRESNTEKP